MGAFITSVRVETLGIHDHVTVWAEGKNIGGLICGKGDGERLRGILMQEEEHERPTPVPPPSLVEKLFKGPIDIEDVPWLVKDFAVLYRVARRFAAACHGRGENGEGPYPAQQALDAQLERLAPAYDQCESVRQRCRNLPRPR